MKVLTKKLYRDIRRQIWQFLAVIVLVLLGICLFVSTYDSYQNLKDSYAETHSAYRFGDIWLKGTDFSGEAESEVRQLNGIVEVLRRLVIDQSVRLSDDSKLEARMIGIPLTDQPELNQFHIVQGGYLQDADDILVEKHFFEYHSLHIGNTIELAVDDSWRSFRVAGEVISPEYIWPAKSRQEVMTSPAYFGVFYLTEETLEDMLGQSGYRNEMVVLTDHSENISEVEATLDQLVGLLGGQNNLVGLTREQQPANAALKQDLDGFSELSVFFPFLFLSIAALSIGVMMSRLIHMQRPQIGVLKANGYSNTSLLAHYLSYGLLVAICGSIPGAVIGSLLARVITILYTSMLSIPIVVSHIDMLTILIGVIIAFVVCLIGTLAPALSTARLRPAVAMRGETPTEFSKRSMVEGILPFLSRLPAIRKIPLRGIERNKRRSMLTLVGIIFAMILIMVSLGMYDSVDHFIHRMFYDIYREDISVRFNGLVPEETVTSLADIDGVETAEAALAWPVVLSASGQRYETVLSAFNADTEMHGFYDRKDEQQKLPDEGVLLGIGLKNELSVAVGDRVSISLNQDLVRQLSKGSAFDTSGSDIIAQARDAMLVRLLNEPFEVEVKGFVSEPLGSFVYVNLNSLQQELRAVGLSDIASMAYLKVDLSKKDAIVRKLNDNDVIVQVEDKHALLDVVNEMMNLFYLFVGLMLLFGSAMALGLIFNTMTVNIMERHREIATLRTLGFAKRTITNIITLENLILVSIALLPGLVIGYWTSYYAMGQFNSDLFQFDLHMRPVSFIVVGVSILLVALISQAPALRWVHRLDLARTIKERAS